MGEAPNFDVRSLGMVTLMAPVLFAMAALYLFRLWPRERSLPYWGASGISLAVAYSLNILRGASADFLVLVVANAAGLLSVCLVLVASRLLLRLPTSTWWLWWVTGAALAYLTYFTYVRPDLGARVLAATVVNLAVSSTLTFTYWRHSTGRLRIPGRAMAVIWATSAAAYLVRLWAARDLAPDAGLDTAPLVVVLVPFVEGFIAMVSLAILITLAVSYQIEAELTAERERTEAANRELERLAATDALTGLNNRGRAGELLADAQIHAKESAQPLAVIMLDVDGFKDVNDTYGHDVGDTVLQDVAATLDRTARGTDMVCRWGGEEFLIVAPGTPKASASALAEDLRSSLSGVLLPDSRAVTASLGVAGFQPGESVSDLVRRADDALYRAKAAGRNRVETA